MEKYIIDFLKEKNKKIAYICIMIIIIIGWGFKNIQYKMLLEIVDILKENIVSIIILIILCVVMTRFLKYIDEKSQEVIEIYNRPIPKRAKNEYIEVILSEYYEEGLRIEVKNLKSKVIKNMKGSIYLYENKNRIQRIEFEISNLLELHTDIIFDKLDEKAKYIWNSFNVFIYKLEFEDQIIKEVFMEKVHFRRTHFMLLNRKMFHDSKILGIKTRYNLAWIKEELKFSNMKYISKALMIFIFSISSFIILDMIKVIYLVVKVLIKYL